MEPKSETMDRSIENKSEALKEEGSPFVLAEDPNSAGNHLVKMESKSEPKDRSIEEEKPHLTHSFTWALVEEKHRRVSCNSARTVEDALKTNPKFEGLAEKKKRKELVLLRNERAICSHFPCSLIKDECLTVKFIKAVNKPGETAVGSAHVRRKGSSDEVVLFHVRVKGGEGVNRILKNPDLKKDVDEMTIFAYKGETVEQALRRDARFLDNVFDEKCILSSSAPDVNMSNLVDDLGDKTYTIKKNKNLQQVCLKVIKKGKTQKFVKSAESQKPDAEETQDPSEQSVSTDDLDVNKSNLVDALVDKPYTIIQGKNLPDSQPSSLEEDFEQSAESQRPDAEENQDPSEQSVNDNTNTSGHKAAEPTPLTISVETRIHLSS